MNNKPNKPFILKYFREGDNQKIITSINNKIYFSKDQNITSGYYVGTIIEDYDNHGVFDTLPLNQLPINMWTTNQVQGVFIRSDKKSRVIAIYLSKSKDYRINNERPIYTIELTEEQAKELWGSDYKQNIVRKNKEVKMIKLNGYTPFEQLRELRDKMIKEQFAKNT